MEFVRVKRLSREAQGHTQGPAHAPMALGGRGGRGEKAGGRGPIRQGTAQHGQDPSPQGAALVWTAKEPPTQGA